MNTYLLIYLYSVMILATVRLVHAAADTASFYDNRQYADSKKLAQSALKNYKGALLAPIWPIMLIVLFVSMIKELQNNS